MTIKELQTAIRRFRGERDWLQFHNPKDMAAALAIEAAELQEIFLWKTKEEFETVCSSKKVALQEEIADIAIYLLELADLLKVDVSDAVETKLAQNALKYPVSKARGSSAKYSEL